ncbi:TetR/AcrR family transcriptional regulator [Nocardiopsis potens]|uniref:TetR/AcrR family transcriptional regulator n=1 Tax=Nocardiopsis potens TaxID=1246458 RepID=UPI00034A2EA8|nr:TetR/AcrR family transcriptional regulator [Nocardiopsis potens]
MADQEVPPELGRLWRVPTAARLGRPAALDVDRIVRTAVGLADRDGLAGVTLAKVAKELGFTAMSLYRHVGSKDELFALMQDHVGAPAPDIDPPPEQWRDGVRQWALALRTLCEEHPWLAEIPVSGPPTGPNMVGWMDALLRALRGTGLDWGAKVGVLLLVSGYVQQTGSTARQMAEGRHASGLDQAEAERAYGRALAGLVDPARYPEAAKLFASDVFEHPADPAEDHDFAFGLELILDGIAAAVDTAARADH